MLLKSCYDVLLISFKNSHTIHFASDAFILGCLYECFVPEHMVLGINLFKILFHSAFGNVVVFFFNVFFSISLHLDQSVRLGQN